MWIKKSTAKYFLLIEMTDDMSQTIMIWLLRNNQLEIIQFFMNKMKMIIKIRITIQSLHNVLNF